MAWLNLFQHPSPKRERGGEMDPEPSSGDDSIPHIAVAPASLTLPGHHASFVFRLRKHKRRIHEAYGCSSGIWRLFNKTVGESVGDSVHKSCDSRACLKKESRQALA